MNILTDQLIKNENNKLVRKFSSYSTNILETYILCKSKVHTWEFSLGITKDIIPHEWLVPSVIKTNGRILSTATKSNSESKNLVSYGFDAYGKLILSLSRPHKDIETFGEKARIIDGSYILAAHIYASHPQKNRLTSICHSFQKNEYIYYISITPPRDWFVRVDKLTNNKISNSQMLATSWFKQINYDFSYDRTENLSKITIGDHIHWEIS
jgi:hypothetical protein